MYVCIRLNMVYLIKSMCLSPNEHICASHHLFHCVPLNMRISALAHVHSLILIQVKLLLFK